MSTAEAFWTPAVDNVAGLLRTRPRTRAGVNPGTFTSETKPTDQEVLDLAAQAVEDVSSDVGVPIPESSYGRAKSVATIRTAMLVELSYFPEQINSGRSPYPQLKELYDERIKSLVTVIEEGDGETPGSADQDPEWDFCVDPLYPLLGRRTRW